MKVKALDNQQLRKIYQKIVLNPKKIKKGSTKKSSNEILLEMRYGIAR